jgi:serine/threonine-protein kinase
LVTASRGAVTRIGHDAPAVPRQLGKYRVLLELGRGGMATVYLGMTQSAGGVSKLVVLKALHPQFAAEAEARAMFLDEARLAAQLNHGNLVQTYEVGQEADRHVIVMEYLEGQSLSRLLKRAAKRGLSLPWGLHVRILMQVLEGLHYTHELRGYDGAPLWPVHRDVSPQNVFITYDGRTKVLDFGIAKAVSSTTHTATGLIKGKIAYMSPEQMAGAAVDRRADVYAVGCMLWAAATGQKLWRDLADVHILQGVMRNAIPSPRSVNPACEAELERIVMKALAPVEARYSSALELHDDLERFCEAQGITDRPRELVRFMTELFAGDRAELSVRVEHELALTQAESALPNRSAPPPKISETRRRWPWLVAAASAAALVVYQVFPRDQEAPRVAAAGVRAAPTVQQAADAKPPTVRIELRSTPAMAKWFVDDQPVQGDPAVGVLPRDGAAHRFREELPGHQPAFAELRATEDQILELSLVQAVTEQKRVRRAAPRSVPSVASPGPAAPVAPKAVDCAQPFYIAADGIKKIKPACL